MRDPDDPRSARGGLALALLCLAFFIDVMGSTSVFAAAPAMARALHLGRVGLQWAIIAATLPGGALLLVGGRCADLFGRRRMFMLSLIGLVIASLGCGLAPSAAVLIVARVALGVSGALLLPAALALLTGTFPNPEARARALGVWAAVGGVGATAGLLLGGAVTAGLGWRWVFLAIVPLALLMLALGPATLVEPARREEARPLDLPGTLTFCAGLGLAVYAVTQLPDSGWRSPRVLATGAAGALLLVAFARVEVRSEHAIVPPRLLRTRSVLAGNLTLVAAGMCVDGLLFTLTLYTQRRLGYSALQFGLVTAVMTATSAGAGWLGQHAVQRRGTAPVATVGLGLLALTGILFALATTVGGLALVLVGMVVFGFGMGGAFVSGSVASLRDVEETEAGVAAAIQNISFGSGATAGVAILSAVAGAVGGTASPAAARAAFVGATVLAALGLCVTAGLSRRTSRRCCSA